MNRIIFSLLCQYSDNFHAQNIISLNTKILVHAGDFYQPDNGLPGRLQSHFGRWTDNWSTQIARKKQKLSLVQTYIYIYFNVFSWCCVFEIQNYGNLSCRWLCYFHKWKDISSVFNFDWPSLFLMPLYSFDPRNKF